MENNKLICPFCGQELECCGAYIFGTKKLGCANCGLTGDSKLFSELIRTRKALDVAVDALKIIGSGKVIEHSIMFHEDDNKIFIAKKALEQITALEQKDVK